VTLFSLAGSRNCVNRTAKPENDLEKKMTDTSGRRCLEQYGRFSRVGSWERMFSDLLIGTGDWYSTKCKLTWKMKGTSYNRMYFQLVPSTHRIGETEFGLLPTPRAMEVVEHPEAQAARLGDRTGGKLNNLSSGAKFGLLPTPTTQEPSTPCEITETGRRMTKDGKGSHSLNLGRIAGMIPTPTAQDFKRRGPNSKQQGLSNTENWTQLLPTPTASDYHARGDQPGWDGSDLVSTMHKITEADGKTSQLNPRFVAEMMGFPPNWTESPFLSGDKNP
jgi:hypothetical protein